MARSSSQLRGIRQGRCTPPVGLRTGGAVSGRSLLLARWPVLDRHPHARSWLEAWRDLGRAPRTVDAYARGLAEYLEVCELRGVDPVLAGRADVAGYVRHLFERPSHRGVNVVAID